MVPLVQSLQGSEGRRPAEIWGTVSLAEDSQQRAKGGTMTDVCKEARGQCWQRQSEF